MSGSPEKPPRSGPRRLVARALLLATLFALLHLLGWRRYAAVLSGTTAVDAAALLRGTAYVLFYGCAVFVSPVLALAAIILSCWNGLRRRVEKTKRPRSSKLSGSLGQGHG